MFKRIAIASTTMVVALLALLLPGTPASACKLGCLEDQVTVSPHGGFAGNFHAGNDPSGDPYIATVSWSVYNQSSSVAHVALSPGSTGCAMPAVPYVSPTELWLDAHETAYVTSYHKSQCVGSGTVYLSAGQDQGYQSINFYS